VFSRVTGRNGTCSVSSVILSLIEVHCVNFYLRGWWMMSPTGSRSSHDLALGKGELVLSSPFPFPRLLSGLLAARAEEKGDGVHPSHRIFFIRYISDLNHWTTLRNFK